MDNCMVGYLSGVGGSYYGSMGSGMSVDESTLLALDQYRGWCGLGFCRMALASSPEMARLVAANQAWINLLFQVCNLPSYMRAYVKYPIREFPVH